MIAWKTQLGPSEIARSWLTSSANNPKRDRITMCDHDHPHEAVSIEGHHPCPPSKSPTSTPSLPSMPTDPATSSTHRTSPAIHGVAARVRALLLAVYVLLPWIPINGHPAVFLDLAERRFHFFGLTFLAEDLWIGFFLLTGLGFSLFYVTSLFGRLWCGWACPYTVFLDHIYRRIERLVDGDAASRKKLDVAPLSGSKVAKRVLKHGLYLLVSLIIAHVFIPTSSPSRNSTIT